MAGPTVTVACKIPNGIIMRVFKREEYDVPVLGGGMRTESRAIALGKPVKINGPAVPHGQTPPFVIAGGYALTPNVPADVANLWMEQNKDSDMVVNNLIHIAEKPEFAEKFAKEKRDVKSGLEPLDVGTVFKNGRHIPRDYRWPKQINPNLSQVGSDNKNDAA